MAGKDVGSFFILGQASRQAEFYLPELIFNICLPFTVSAFWSAIALFTEWKACCIRAIQTYRLSIADLASGTERAGGLEEGSVIRSSKGGAVVAKMKGAFVFAPTLNEGQATAPPQHSPFR